MFKRTPINKSRSRRKTSIQRVGYGEYFMTIASRIYFSNFYRLVYGFTILACLVCVCWTAYNQWKIPSSVIFITLEITVSLLLVFEVTLRMLAFKRRFWSKCANIFDVITVIMSIISILIYFQQEGEFFGELEEIATDAILIMRNGLQYMRLAIFLKNRTEKRVNRGGDIDFGDLSLSPIQQTVSLPQDKEQEDLERTAMLDAEIGCIPQDDIGIEQDQLKRQLPSPKQNISPKQSHDV